MRLTCKRLLLIAAVLGLVAPGAGCRRNRETPDPGIPYASSTDSPKLATFIFKEEGKLYLMTVGVNATRFHDKDPFIPLAVLLVNKSKTPLNIDRESFTLVEPVSGARYGLASIDEVRRQGKQEYDRKLMDLEHLLSKLTAFTPLETNFFPNVNVIIEHAELHQFMYMLDTLYFPRPEGALLGKRFELHVNSKGLEQPLFVVFTVPEK
ncbi:MAG TPA: hypothetical protein VFE84_10395 [Patescibacteria group bacterium]|jgi:hypothetical protein|nr:hypothetical protein [Patescibacteria group bacterium]